MATLTLVNLAKHFGTVAAVDGVNLRVNDGEFLCILGPSGCGKSTALRLIAGFEEPTSGDIQIDDQSVTAIPPNRRPTAMVFQKYTLWPHMKVYENIAFGLQLRKLPAAEIRHKVQDALDLVGMSEYGPRYPAQLSGGQQQRVALARALVLEPKILLLDEPFSSLDAILRVRLREELRRIQRRLHITAIFVTHDQEEALTLADQIAVMNSGRLEQLDRPSAIYAHPKTLFVADFIGAMNMLPATIQDGRLRVWPHSLSNPNGVQSGPVTVAIRPEDLMLVSGDGLAWNGKIEQMMDLGHYRKALVDVPGIGIIKVYLSKSVSLNEGENIALYPTRYLVYQGNTPPVEMAQELPEGAPISG